MWPQQPLPSGPSWAAETAMSQPVKLAILLVLIAFPLLEIGLLIRAGQSIGFWRLALIVVGTALLGSFLIRRIGVSVLQKMLARAEVGRGGVHPVLDGLLLGIAGVLLILPGLLSDVLGLLLLIPHVRRGLIYSGIAKLFATGTWRTEVFEGRFESRRRPDTSRPNGEDDGMVIEGEYERIAEEPAERRPKPPRKL